MMRVERLWLAGLGLALGVASIAAQLPTPLPEVGPLVGHGDQYPGHDGKFPNGVKGVPGVIYWTQVGFRPLKLDLYLPPATVRKPSHGFPLVVFIHGGGWTGGNSRVSGMFVDFPGVLAALSARGYVVASVEYRLSGEAIFPAQIQDVKAAILFLRTRADEYGIDPTKAITWGTSAGGHLAALAAVSCGVKALEPVQTIKAPPAALEKGTHAPDNVSDCVQGSVTWFGVFDFATIEVQAKMAHAMSRDVPTTPEWRLLGCFASKCKKGQMAFASPVTYVDAKSPPMLLVVGSDDRTVPSEQTLEMAEKLDAAGVMHELMVIPGVDHVLIGKSAEETRDANLGALEATFRFIDRAMRMAR